MILYIIRHADPDYENNTITPFGWEEAHALADWLKDMPIDKIYTSPLGRAIDTAAPTCKIKGMESTILPWTSESMDYMESNHLTPKSQCRYKFSLQAGTYDFEDFMENDRIKTIEEMRQNSDEFLASLGYEREGIFYKVTRPNEERIAVFCHGGFGVEWISHLLGMAPGLMFSAIILNTSSVTTFEFPNSPEGYIRPQLKHLNEIYHIHQAGLRINNR